MHELAKWTASLEEKCRLADTLYMALFSSTFLNVGRDHGEDAAARLNFSVNRLHHYNHFLEGIKKLAIDKEPTDAIISAKYHYLSNALGGVDMEYAEETPNKVWVRYLAAPATSDAPFAPSVSISGGSQKVLAIMFEGWHAWNGVSLGNPRLGFVLTHLMVNGDPYDSGYFKIYDHDLRPDELLQYSPGEVGPPHDPERAPKLDPEVWPPERRFKVLRNYAVTYMNDIIADLLNVYGRSTTKGILERAYKITWLSYHKEIMRVCQIPYREVSMLDTTGAPPNAKGIATLFQRLRGILNEEATIEEASPDRYIIRQSARNPHLYPELYPVEIDEAEVEGWKVLTHLLNPGLTVAMTQALTAGDSVYEWVVKPRWIPPTKK